LRAGLRDGALAFAGFFAAPAARRLPPAAAD